MGLTAGGGQGALCAQAYGPGPRHRRAVSACEDSSAVAVDGLPVGECATVPERWIAAVEEGAQTRVVDDEAVWYRRFRLGAVSTGAHGGAVIRTGMRRP